MSNYFGFAVFAYVIVTVLAAPCCFLAVVSDFVVICIYPFVVVQRHGRFFYLLCLGFCCFNTGLVHFQSGIFCVW